MYSELASWFHLLMAPADDVEEAAEQALRLLTEADRSTAGDDPRVWGWGGGNNASHMKARTPI